MGSTLLTPDFFFDLDRFADRDLFQGVDLVWEAVPRIKEYLTRTLSPNVAGVRAHGDMLQHPVAVFEGRVYREGVSFIHGDPARGTFRVLCDGEDLPGAAALYPGAVLLSDDVQLGPGVVVEPGALIWGPTKIGAHTVVRQGAYVRGSCLVGARCVVGHTTEMKNSVMLDDAKAGHFAYIGDSIIGVDANLGAGTKLANLKVVSSAITIPLEDGTRMTVAFRKLGAILGDGCQTGCNSVTNPGTLLGKECVVSPCVSVPCGYYRPKSVIR